MGVIQGDTRSLRGMLGVWPVAPVGPLPPRHQGSCAGFQELGIPFVEVPRI